ncbi:tyrosine--tRNA ligase [Anoxynatronum buryatiense]|uniref:Tyrosine--tRNA ligase n=1 Tax=Anoxynatronum buryatiense TaxID=489973 RepID=A0AA45WT88_9CLOT|nr:tyrosine--tRNA ligase [Anoxynatronum buryatiense]SMP40654.1 tyrosyl-tRNA synthetase [Anoxynatronum buryatiense]
MSNVFDVLKERGYVAQVTHEEDLRQLLGEKPVTFYIGFDATAESLHLGHYVQIMVMMHLQKAGHRPLVLLGGGTTMVGDPSGKTDMRKMLTQEQIQHNALRFKAQFERFLEFGEDKACIVDNAEWLLELNYVEFLRNIGRHFSVNRMLAAECYKSRLDQGLTFLEFNYMIMQAYDFLELYRRYDCQLQMGGDDQWSNILAGYELIRKVERDNSFALTFQLLTTSEGKKMGKTESGALWLDPEKTSPYEFYQYLRNVDDRDVEKTLKLLTFVSMEDIKELCSAEGAALNRAKEVLAFEATRIVHGEEAARHAQEAARAAFSGGVSEDMPTTALNETVLKDGLDILTLLMETGLAASRSEARRLVQQGGISINDEKIAAIETVITLDYLDDGQMIIKKGKKVYHRVVAE